VSASFGEWVFDQLSSWAGVQSSRVSVYQLQVAGQPPVDPVTLVGRYLVVQGGSNPRRTPGAVDGVSRDVSATVTVTSAAWFNSSMASPALAASRLADSVENLIVDVIPDVDGWAGCSPVQQVMEPTIRTDESTADRKLVYLVGQYSVLADRFS
jgi:hypothetical protein